MLQNLKILSTDMTPRVQNFTPELMWWVTVKAQMHSIQFTKHPQEKKDSPQPASAAMYLFWAHHDSYTKQPEIVHMNGWDSDTFACWFNVHKFVSCTKLLRIMYKITFSPWSWGVYEISMNFVFRFRSHPQDISLRICKSSKIRKTAGPKHFG